MKKFEKNSKYDGQVIGQILEAYKLAKKQGNHVLMWQQANLIYEFTQKYVFDVLWKKYGNILGNQEHRDDLIQSVWLKIFEEIEHYDSRKASITVFLFPWIQHAVTDYCSKNIWKTSPYYAKKISQVDDCIAWCRARGIEPTPNIISEHTGLSEKTVIVCMNIMQCKDTVTIDSIYEMEILDNKFRTPQEQAIYNENTKISNEILKRTLSDFEIQVIQILVNLNAVNNRKMRNKASYREIALCLKREYGITTTITTIKNTISDITIKLKDYPKLVQI